LHPTKPPGTPLAVPVVRQPTLQVKQTLAAMKYLFNILPMLLLILPLAADECTFDREHHVEIIQNAATQYPGGITQLDELRVTWQEPDGRTTIFGYGGCDDLGSVVSQADRMDTSRSQAQIFELARNLANRFWNDGIIEDSLAQDVLVTSLEKSEYSVEQGDRRTFFHIHHHAFVELYVEHEFDGDVDRVSITWQGNW
jgi:hypothetical protein